MIVTSNSATTCDAHAAPNARPSVTHEHSTTEARHSRQMHTGKTMARSWVTDGGVGARVHHNGVALLLVTIMFYLSVTCGAHRGKFL